MRHKPAVRRTILPDSKYGNPTIAKFINFLMERGKKSAAEKIMYGAFDIIDAAGKKAIDVFELAFANVTPQVEVRSRRVGGANYQIPMPVRGERQRALAFRWLIGAARARKGHSMAEKLASELQEAADGVGDAVKKKADVHRMAEANRAFAHFARVARK
ncbi:MAG: 30S ribosomal protein S7 [Candidatus Magasanikbacteria bacterium]|nr:30S ribosomal protein S7 [Candidatus Magasanikbacteria bacterium]